VIRLIPKILAAIVAVVLLVVVGLSVALPRIVNSDEFRAELHRNVATALGTPVAWSRFEVGLVPLRLTIEAAILEAPIADPEDARLTARSIDLRLSAVALLERRIEVDSLVFRGLELVMTRTREGLVLPVTVPTQEPAAEASPASTEPPSSGKPSSPASPRDPVEELELALHRMVIEDGRIVVRDQTLARPVEWTFDAFELEATGDDLERPLALEVAARISANGRDAGEIGLSGEASLSGLYDLDLSLDAIRLDELQPYLTEAVVAGVASGRVSLAGGTGVVARSATDLQIEEMRVSTFGLDLDGRLDLASSQERDEPAHFDAKIDLGLDGRAHIQGKLGLDGAIDAVIALDALDLVPFAALAGPEVDVEGHATGQVEIATTEGGEVERLETDLRIPDARYADAAVDLRGRLDLGLAFQGFAPTDRFRFDVGLALDDEAGHIDAEGAATLAGAVDAKLVLGNVDLAPIAPWVPPGTRIEGRLTGDADLGITAERSIERISVNLALAEARVARDPVDVAGRFDLTAALRGEGPIDLDAALVLEDGSELRVEGTSTTEGSVDVRARLESFDVANARPFVADPEMRLEGLATGKARLVGDVAAPEFVSFELGVDRGVLVSKDASLEGPFLAGLKIKEPFTRPRGKADLDLTAARLRYGESFAKPSGVRAEANARFVPEESGEVVFESQLALRDIDTILVQGAIGDTTSVAVSTTNFDLAGWDEILPVLAPYSARGIVSLDGVGVELAEGEPQRFGGRLALRGVALTLPDAGRVQLRGTILGEEMRIRTKGLKAKLGPAVIAIRAAIEDPAGEGRFDLEIETDGPVEANDVLSNLTSVRDRIYGPLLFDGRVTGRLDDSAGATSTLAGKMRFTIGEGGGGRLRGVSLLQTILDQIPLVGQAASVSRAIRGGRSVDDYFAGRFDVIEGDFVIGDGRVDAETLRLAHPGYEAWLTGPVRLEDLAIDMSGYVLLKDDLVGAIGGLAGADVQDRDPIRIELAKVTNTLTEPKVEMTAETLSAVPKLLIQGTGLDTITLGIGKGVGRALDRALGGD